MSIKVKDLFIEVGFKVDKQGANDLEKVNRKVEGFSSIVKNVKVVGFIAKITSIRYALNALKWGLESTLGVLTSFLKAGSDKERIDITFEVLTKSAALGKKTLEELHELAIKRPFTVPEVEKGAATLLAMGFEAEKLKDMMGQISDITAGLPSLTLERFAYNLGQVRAATYLRGMELRDFISQGVPLMDELLKLDKFRGVDSAGLRKLIELRQVSFEDVAAAIKNMTSEGGLFFKMGERVMTTLSGMYSRIKDIVTLVMRGVGEKITPTVKPLVEKFIKWFLRNKEKIVAAIAKPMALFAEAVMESLAGMAKLIKYTRDFIDAVMGLNRFIALFKGLLIFLFTRYFFAGIAWFVVKWGLLGTAIANAGGYLKVFTKLMGLAWTATKKFFAVFTAKALILAFLGLLIQDLYLYSEYGDKADTVTGYMIKKFPTLFKWFKLLQSVGFLLLSLIVGIFTGDGKLIKEGWNNFKKSFKDVFKMLKDTSKSLRGINDTLASIAKWLGKIIDLLDILSGGEIIKMAFKNRDIGKDIGEAIEHRRMLDRVDEAGMNLPDRTLVDDPDAGPMPLPTNKRRKRKTGGSPIDIDDRDPLEPVSGNFDININFKGNVPDGLDKRKLQSVIEDVFKVNLRSEKLRLS